MTTTHDELAKLTFEEIFERYKNANSSRSIIYFFEIICKKLNIDLKKYYNDKTTQICTNNTSTQSTSSSSTSPSTNVITTRILYQIIRTKVQHWKASTLWSLFDKRLQNKDYKRLRLKDMKVLIIGCGPVGLRLSIECALLGLKTVIIEKRDKYALLRHNTLKKKHQLNNFFLFFRFSRNNVLHLWPYTIVDLKNLGAKFFYGKFCAGSIDHISK